MIFVRAAVVSRNWARCRSRRTITASSVSAEPLSIRRRPVTGIVSAGDPDLVGATTLRLLVRSFRACSYVSCE